MRCKHASAVPVEVLAEVADRAAAGNVMPTSICIVVVLPARLARAINNLPLGTLKLTLSTAETSRTVW